MSSGSLIRSIRNDDPADATSEAGAIDYFLNLSKKDFWFAFSIILFFCIFFYLIFSMSFVRVSAAFTAIQSSVFGIVQIAELSALTLAFTYCYQLTKNSSFLYLALCWYAHAMYKVFRLGFPESGNGILSDDSTGYQYLLIAIIALAADFPLFLSSFSDKNRKWWLPLVPLSTLFFMVIIFNANMELAEKIRIAYVVGPLQSSLILLWMTYSTTELNILHIPKKLAILFGFCFFFLACYQVPFITQNYCFPCAGNSISGWYWNLAPTILFASMLAIVFFVVKAELTRTRKEKDAALEKLEVKGEFEDLGYLAASIEHELRNPLQALKHEIRELHRLNQHDAEITRRTESLELQVDRVSLAANVIKILRLKPKVFTRSLKETPIMHRITGSVKYVKREKPLFSQKLNVSEIEKTKELYVMALPQFLEQAFINLLKNSYEAIDATGKRGQVVIEVFLIDKETIGVRFGDNGPGFIQQDIPRLTKPEYTKKDLARSESNRGLGLFVCEKIVTLHSGSISFSNAPGGGAVVDMRFPRHFTKKMLGSDSEDQKESKSA